MFGYLNKSQIRQCLTTHRKHVKRKSLNICEIKRQFSSRKYIKLGDLYARLGLLAGASQPEIKKAYYKLSKEYHPDRNEGCDVSASKFRSITEAYEILGNETTRAQYDKETPYGRATRRATSYKPQPSSSFHEKDEELAEKIRTYRENMRRKGKKRSESEEFQFRRENLFDFDAWYRAHFQEDYGSKIRKERIQKFAEQYQEQMMRISRGQYRIRPPRPYLERKELSDIEKQMYEMVEKEMNQKIMNVLHFGIICLIALFTVLCIIEYNNKKNAVPYQDPYAKQNDESSTKIDDKKA
ncbi:dnaJ homolog subfamily C member 17-like [Contarinia nasturtii]|uniref:dnaJ homolog subfamily C member 17-like n=1 Tax=Contarinia nasturtii TaxID=265458 RepID=UPI0012D46765|nr:dnaJ homolog subfamily C member 17-like [Contarinia nasturtii]